MDSRTHYYEGMFLLDSADFAGDPDGLTSTMTGLLERFGGNVVAHRPWQDGRLAYEVAGRRKGLHYLILFTLDPAKMTELNRACTLNDKILRTMFIHHSKVIFDATVDSIDPQEQAEDEAPEPVEVGADED